MDVNSIKGRQTSGNINTSQNINVDKQNSSANDTTNTTRNNDAVSVNEVTNEALDKAIEEMNRRLVGVHTRFEYGVHEYTNTITIRVLDTDTDELIREVPPESRLDAIAKMWAMVGIMVDDAI